MIVRILVPIAQAVQAGLRGLQWAAYWLGRGFSRAGHRLDAWIVARLRKHGPFPKPGDPR